MFPNSHGMASSLHASLGECVLYPAGLHRKTFLGLTSLYYSFRSSDCSNNTISLPAGADWSGLKAWAAWGSPRKKIHILLLPLFWGYTQPCSGCALGPEQLFKASALQILWTVRFAVCPGQNFSPRSMHCLSITGLMGTVLLMAMPGPICCVRSGSAQPLLLLALGGLNSAQHSCAELVESSPTSPLLPPLPNGVTQHSVGYGESRQQHLTALGACLASNHAAFGHCFNLSWLKK